MQSGDRVEHNNVVLDLNLDELGSVKLSCHCHIVNRPAGATVIFHGAGTL